MPRPGATRESDERVRVLVGALFEGLDDAGESLAETAAAAGMEYETVRSLLRPGQRRLRAGPGFLVVASIARARGVSLDAIADQVPGLPPIRRLAGAPTSIRFEEAGGPR